MKAEIIAVGTELLLGQIVNTNATFLSEVLASQGIEVYHQSVVGDNEKRLQDSLALAQSRSELIVLCGGLGPTTDDLTKQVTAAFLGQPLVYDKPSKQKLYDFFDQRQQTMTPNNLNQAFIFRDSEALPNETGLAVGIFYQSLDNRVYVLLPGPPNELYPMVHHELIPRLQALQPNKERFISRVLRFYGIGESRLVTLLEDLIAQQTNPTIAPYAKTGEVTLRLTVKTEDEANGEALLDQLETEIQERVGHYFYGYGDENSLAQVVVDQLKAKKKTVTAAESLTAGLLQATIASIPGASEVFPGGFVTYQRQTKADFLGIDPAYLKMHGTVSKECVEAMALHAKARAKTDYALALSGVAGPETLEGHVAGTVWLALATNEQVMSRCLHLSKNRNAVREHSVLAALDWLRRELLK